MTSTATAPAPAKARPVADDDWLHGASEPPAGETPARRALARRDPLPQYRPVPRKPLGGTRWPFILVEGGEYSGKSTAVFNLSASSMFSRVLVLAVGEDVDEFGALNPDFEVLPHDGTWHQIWGCVEYAAEQAQAAIDAGEKPILFIIESMTKIWELLSEWAENRARSAPANRAKLEQDPNDEPDTHPVYWTPANKRHQRLVTRCVTMPAVVVATARAKDVVEMVNGQPTKNRIYKIECQRMLPYSTTATVRLSVDHHPTITGLRRVGGGIQPPGPNGRGGGRAVEVTPERFGREFDLEWLLTHVMKFDPATARVSSVVEPRAGAEPDGPPPAAYQATPPADAVVVAADEAPGRSTPTETRPEGGRRG